MLVSISIVVVFLHYGLDLTDESYYLINIANPGNYSETVGALSHFGFVYAPIFDLFAENVAALRMFSIVVTLLLGTTLAWLILTRFREWKFSVQTRLTISLLTAAPITLIAVFNGQWLPTPSYNSLNLVGLLLFFNGIFGYTTTNSSVKSKILWMLVISLGLSLEVMAKPSTAALSFFVCISCLILLPNKRLLVLLYELLGVTLCTAVISLIAVVAIYGNVEAAGNSFLLGAKSAWLLQGTQLVSKQTELEKISLFEEAVISLAAGAILLSVILHILRRILSKERNAFVYLAQLAIMFAGCVIAAWNQLNFALAINGAAIWLAFSTLAKVKQPKDWREYLLGLSLMSGPMLYAAGSNNNYWVSSQSAVVLSVLGTVFLFLKVSGVGIYTFTKLASFLFLVQVFTLLQLLQATENPYRQDKLDLKGTVKLAVPNDGQVLWVSKQLGQEIDKLRIDLMKQDFVKGSPMLDLTGRSPGLIFAVEGASLGAAWHLGGYPGSENYFIHTIEEIDCSILASAWIIAESESSLAISPRVLSKFGAQFPTDYEEVSRFSYSPGESEPSVSGYRSIYKPSRQNIVANKCKELQQ